MERTEGKENGVTRRFGYDAFRQQAIERMLAGDKELGGKDGLLAPLLKDLLDAALSGEMQGHVEQNRPQPTQRQQNQAGQDGSWSCRGRDAA